MVKYYVAFFKNMNPLYIFADVLEIAEGNDYSHVEIVRVVNDDWSEATSYGSIFPKSRSINLVDLMNHYQMMMVIPLTVRVNEEEAKVIVNSLMGKSYSFIQILMIALRIVFGFGLSWLNKAKPNLSKHLICTEAVGLFMQEACQYRFETSPDMLTLNEVKEIAINGLLKD